MIYPNPTLQPFSASVLESQRRYEALVFLTRGYGDSLSKAPQEDRFHITQPDQRGNINVVESFVTAPLLAYLDGIPAGLVVNYEEAERRFHVAAQVGDTVIGRKGALLKLVWSNGKELTACELVKQPKRNKTRTFSLLIAEAPYGANVDIVSMEEEPLEVWIGSRELTDLEFQWEDKILSIHVPRDLEAGHVVIITSTAVWMSATHFRPAGLPTRIE